MYFLVWNKKKVSVRRPALQWRGPDDVRASGQKGPDFWRAQRRSDISFDSTLHSSQNSSFKFHSSVITIVFLFYWLSQHLKICKTYIWSRWCKRSWKRCNLRGCEAKDARESQKDRREVLVHFRTQGPDRQGEDFQGMMIFPHFFHMTISILSSISVREARKVQTLLTNFN